MAENRFKKTLQAAPIDGGFQMEDYWVWDGSAIKGEDGRYHLFSSRWPKKYCMHPGWTFHSEIIRCSSDTPEGPYQFEEVVFERRDPHFFDARMTHNPTIHKCGDDYLLFYTGVSYEEDLSDPEIIDTIKGNPDLYAEYWNRKRIGLASSKSVLGPWKRPDKPIMEPAVGSWDETILSNAAPAVLPDGSVYCLYKSNKLSESVRGPFKIGLAYAEHWQNAFIRKQKEPVFTGNVEDPYMWYQDGMFHAIMKDMSGEICGEHHGGIYATSEDCIHWNYANPPLAYSRNVEWTDGSITKMGFRERPQLMFENGVPTHLFNATGNGPGTGFNSCEKTWTMCCPILSG